MLDIVVSDLDQLKKAAELFTEIHKEDRFFALYGSMGAGKTTLIKEICEKMGVEDYVNSPTFSIVNEYQSQHGELIYHFDFYRIESMEEAFDIGYENYFFSEDRCFVEWPQLVEPLLPENHIAINIELLDNGDRHITTERVGK